MKGSHRPLLVSLIVGAFLFIAPTLPFALAGSPITVEGTGLNNSAEGIFDKSLTLSGMIGVAIKGLLGIIGAVFLILIVYGGVLWMTSEGAEQKVSAARGFIFHSVLGLIIVLAAYAITTLVIEVLTKTTLN